MGHAGLLPTVAALLAAVSLAACGADDDDEREPAPRPDARAALVEAAQRTLGAGPSAVTVTLRTGTLRYRLAGRVDPARGYRLCAAVIAAADPFPRGRSLWLEGRGGSYETITAPGRGCAPRKIWLDDHPPTLPLHNSEPVEPLSAPAGGEDFLHATLLALTRLSPATVVSARARRCGDAQCLRAVVRFPALHERSPVRDEDRWTLLPLLRSLGRHPVAVRIDADGYLSRIELTAAGAGPPIDPVTVALVLSDHGEAQRVPRVHANAIE